MGTTCHRSPAKNSSLAQISRPAQLTHKIMSNNNKWWLSKPLNLRVVCYVVKANCYSFWGERNTEQFLLSEKPLVPQILKNIERAWDLNLSPPLYNNELPLIEYSTSTVLGALYLVANIIVRLVFLRLSDFVLYVHFVKLGNFDNINHFLNSLAYKMGLLYYLIHKMILLHKLCEFLCKYWKSLPAAQHCFHVICPETHLLWLYQNLSSLT